MAAVIVEIDRGPTVCIRHHSYPVYKYEADGDRLVRQKVGHYEQSPILPAYAMSIHRSQGADLCRIQRQP